MMSCAVGVTERFKLEVGLHQGSALILIACYVDGYADTHRLLCFQMTL